MIFQFFVILNQTIRIICYDTNWMMLSQIDSIRVKMNGKKKCIKLLLAQFECQVSGLFRRRHVCLNMCVWCSIIMFFSSISSFHQIVGPSTVFSNVFFSMLEFIGVQISEGVVNAAAIYDGPMVPISNGTQYTNVAIHQFGKRLRNYKTKTNLRSTLLLLSVFFFVGEYFLVTENRPKQWPYRNSTPQFIASDGKLNDMEKYSRYVRHWR